MTAPRRRPLFVSVLALVAALIGGAELAGIFVRPPEGYEQVWFGFKFEGEAARMAAIPHVIVYLGGAWGLWNLREWARVGAMGYMVYLIASFLIWGVRASGQDGVWYVMAYQLTVLPFCTFCTMFLYNGTRFFRPRHAAIDTAVSDG